jgi:integrase
MEQEIMAQNKKTSYIEKTLENQLNEQQLEFLHSKYLPYLNRKGLKQSSQNNYLQSLRKILTQTNFSINELNQDNYIQKSREVAGLIQDSHFRLRETGGNSKRRKNHQWNTWKQIIQLQGFNTDQLPDFKAKENQQVQTQARETRPEQLPNPRQVKEFVKAIGKHSGDTHKLRNQTLILLMWDLGPRIGEALNIQIKDVELDNDQIEIHIEGNKKSEDRTVNIFQGRKTFKDFYQNHPGRKEDYLFSDLHHNKLDNPVNSRKFAEKINKVKNRENFQFKTFGEPNHIFRKAMTTAHIVNDWMTWEEITKVQGKSTSGTKPVYLKMALSDVNKSRAEKMGVENQEKDADFHMKGEPLLPQKCKACQRINKCFKQTCEYCSGNLKTPTRSSFQEEQQGKMESIMDKAAELSMKMEASPEKTLKEMKEEVLE